MVEGDALKNRGQRNILAVETRYLVSIEIWRVEDPLKLSSRSIIGEGRGEEEELRAESGGMWMIWGKRNEGWQNGQTKKKFLGFVCLMTVPSAFDE